MKLRLHTLLVLMKKDIQLLLCNKNVIIMILLPICFCVLYQTMFADMSVEGMPPGFVLSLCTLLALCSITLTGVAMMVAEEKEKNTLRVLMLNDVSAVEYILSKTCIMLLVCEFTCVFMFFLTSSPITALLPYILLTAIVSISMMLFGSLIGLISKDQMSTGTLSTPLMVLFLIPPMFSKLQINEVIDAIAKLMPTNSMDQMISASIAGKHIVSTAYLADYGIILAWIVISLLAFSFVYKKRRIDN